MESGTSPDSVFADSPAAPQPAGVSLRVLAPVLLAGGLLPALLLAVLEAQLALAVYSGLYLLGVVWLAQRWVVRPLRLLAGAMRHIELGRYRPWMQAPRGPLREMQVLHRGLHGMWLGLERRGRARDAALEELSRREQGYRGLFEANPNIMWISDAETLVFLAVNDAAIEHYGYSRHEFLSMTLADLLPPEDREDMGDPAGEAPDDAPGPRYLRGMPRIWRHVTRGGRTLLVEVARHDIEFAARPARLSLVTDVTQRLAGESRLRQRLDDANAQLAHARRELASARSLVGGLGQLAAEPGRLEPVLRRLQRLAQLAQSPLAPEVVDLSAMAEREVHLLRLGEPARRVHVEVQPQLVALADASLAHDLLRELLANAWSFTRGRNNAWIRVGRHGEAGPFFVSDNGVGFEAADQARLFLPFERLPSQAGYAGQGLGLAIALAAAQRHRGRVWAQSEPGQGATFLFTLAPAPAQGEVQVAEVVIEPADQAVAPTGT
jgi:PAS domain S-box-containing protein